MEERLWLKRSAARASHGRPDPAVATRALQMLSRIERRALTPCAAF